MPPTKISIAGAGSDVHPEGTSGLAREMNGADDTRYQELDWSTPDGKSTPLEIVLQVEEIRGALTGFNMCNELRWQIYSWGHGDQTYDVPPTMGQTALAGQVRQPQWPLLARGVVARVTARRLRLNIVNNRADGSALVRASINPMASAAGERFAFPLHDFRDTSGRSFFPMGAREFRLRNNAGGLVEFYVFSSGAAPALESVRLVSDFFDWSQLDQRWFSYVVPAGTYADYR